MRMPLLAAVLTAACSTVSPRPTPAPTRQAGSAEARPPAWIAKMDSGRARFTAEDVRFMQGMIRHHAQAVLMAG